MGVVGAGDVGDGGSGDDAGEEATVGLVGVSVVVVAVVVDECFGFEALLVPFPPCDPESFACLPPPASLGLLPEVFPPI